jgi:hypothetical protein
MGAWTGWSAAILLMLGGILALAHLGVNIEIGVGSLLHGLQHALARPL